MTASRFVLPAALAGVTLGVVMSDSGRMRAVVLATLLAVGLCAAVASAAPPIRLLAATLAALALGIAVGGWRGASSELPAGPDSVAALVGAREWQVSGTLVEEPRPKAERVQLVLEQVVASGSDRSQRAVRGRLLVWLPRGGQIVAGDRISLSAKLEEPRDFDGFGYRAYLARQGIAAIARAREARVVGHQLGLLPEAAAALRRWLLDGLNAVVPEPEAALGAGILLGVRSGISPEIGDAFAAAGLTHVVAISGWNIAIVAALVAAALQPLRRRPGGTWLAPAITFAAIGGYVVLTGSTPSVVRAALMAGAILVARLGGSRAHAASVLMLAALLMLLAAPAVLWDVGFQLSLLATAGLIWFGAGMEARLARLPALLREPIALTLAAQLTTLPVILLNFERLSLIAPLANVLVVPLVPLVMLCCALAAPIGALASAVHLPLIGDAATWLAGGSAWLYLRVMVLAGSAAAAVPFASVPLSAPAWLGLAWYPALTVAWLRLRRTGEDEPEVELSPLSLGARRSAARGPMLPWLRRLLRPSSLLIVMVLALGVISLLSLPDGRLHLTMLDVGQGDAILVEAPSGATMLIDGGPDPDMALQRIGQSLPFFQHHIDVVLLTHPHQDHVAGLVEVLRRYEVGLVLDSGHRFGNATYARFLALARAEPGARLIDARAGQRLQLDARTSLTILYPAQADAEAALPEDDINNASVVGLLRSDAFTALLTGDAEAPVEERLLGRGLLSRVDVLKVGHHGSTSSSSPRMLAALQPATALISDGADNDYGHPSPRTLAALAAIGARVHRTDLEGNVEVVSDGRSFAVASRTLRDPPRAVGEQRAEGGRDVARLTSAAAAASIAAWPFLDSTARARFSPRSSCPTASSSTRRVCGASRRRRRDWCARPGSRSTCASSRSPPCCMTWTSSRPAPRARCTAWSPRGD